MNFDKPPIAENLEKYRSYLRLFAQMRLSVRLRVKADASDVVQRVMLAACKDLNAFRGETEEELLAWLRKIAENEVKRLGRHYSRLRREIKREVPLATNFDQSSIILYRSLVGKAPEARERLIAKEECDLLADALVDLLEDERTVVVLRHVHDWTYAEIAKHIGRSEKAVPGLMYRGLTKLRERLRRSPSESSRTP